ncbi:hypothetical protein INT46_010199 [Mucor plumbeus]|uniref:RING/U-box superfamily protein n=1 Tax=Mucor plumbeus TaxID=97098 RepID=A0A8H7QEH8_9FUNG|nr:hypothetical protein INT46_010199 [Mucor plumbeus]
MPSSTSLNHRHQPSNLSFSSASSSSSSTRPALPQILSNSASNAVNFTRSTAPTSRRVRSHWFTHFVLNWRRSSRQSKLLLGCSMTLVGMQIIASVAVLLFSWEMYCDKPLRVFVTVYILRLVLTAPITIYLHLAPRRRPTSTIVSPRSSARAELSEAYAMSERNRPVSFPPPILPTSTNRNHYPAFLTPTQQIPQPTTQQLQPELLDDNLLKAWIDRAKSALDLFAVLWFIIGNYMIFSSSTCSDTAQPLYYLSLGLIVYGYLILSVPVFLCTSVIFCLPCVLVGMRLLHVDDGVYMGGATSEEIAMIPVYQFKSIIGSIETSNQIKLVNPTATAITSDTYTTTTTTTTTTITTTTTTTTTPTTTTATPTLNDTQITIDLSKSDHHHQQHQKQKPGLFDKLWLYLGLINPPSEIEPEHDILEIPDVQDQVCAICLSTYEDGDILCRLW